MASGISVQEALYHSPSRSIMTVNSLLIIELQRFLQRDFQGSEQFPSRPFLAIHTRNLRDPSDPPRPRLLHDCCAGSLHGLIPFEVCPFGPGNLLA